ncbi:MAG: type II toxin-antitoxin system Phd/YefM family antitoxin [Deltaproteobacteria bacterium]|nr:type II toxin-antitoxin system Phd/YefM family antitoxin [Deltaproteobacteria bacterium]
MKTLSLSEVKMKLSALIEEVLETDEQIVITRHGKPIAVISSHDEIESLKETAAILNNQDFLGEIKKGLKELKDKKGKLYNLEELLP